MWIKRENFDKIHKIAASRPALFLSGSRQTGKSTLLKKAFPHYTYLSLDLPALALFAQENPKLFLEQHLKDKPGIILDEIQYAPELTRHLKILIDEDRAQNGRFILTSSQIFESIKALSESLAGRISIQKLYPLSQREVLDAGIVEHALTRGFYPELVANPHIDSEDFFNSYIMTYLEKDLRALLAVNDLRSFDRFLRALATRVGSLLNLSDIARDVGVTSPTIKQWFNVLEETGIVYSLEPYFNNRDKRWTKSPKFYFADPGLLSFYLKIKKDSELIRHPMGDRIWENFVVMELVKRLPLLNPRAEVFYLRDHQAKEVDLYIDLGTSKLLVEIKHKEVPSEKDAENLHLHERALKLKPEHTSKWIACLTPTLSAMSGKVKLFNPLHESVDCLLLYK